jgi:hypothetical protein
MSSFDEQPVERKYTIAATLTLEQRIEANVLKTYLGITSDTALLKKALAALSNSLPDFERIMDATDKSNPDLGRSESGTDEPEGGDAGFDPETGTISGEAAQESGGAEPDPWAAKGE